MWIKVTMPNDRDVFVNANNVDVIVPFDTEDGQGCNLYFNRQELPLKIKTTFCQIDTLLNVNSIEKCIDRLKVERAQLEQRIQFDKIFGEIYGARAKKGNEDLND